MVLLFRKGLFGEAGQVISSTSYSSSVFLENVRENKPNASGQCFLFCRKLSEANGVIFLGCI